MSKLTLDKTKSYLLACSFGPDSMALFYMLLNQDFNFECAIVNYHLRKESNDEVKKLIDYASKNNIKVHVLDYKGKYVGNIEAKCRQIRYSFFKDLVNKYGFDSVLVAHHQDDLIETYLMQKSRQNCPIFYGIKEETRINGVKVIRPLLGFSKSALLKICKSNSIPFAVDKTNFDLSIKRNYIRHEIVMKMNEADRNDVLKKIDKENAKISTILGSIDFLKLNDAKYVVSLDDLSQKYLLNYLVKDINEKYYLSRKNVGQIINILKSKKPNSFTHIKGSLHLYRAYDNFKITDVKLEDVNYSYSMSSPSLLDAPFFYADFSKGASNRNVKDDDYPITIRKIRPGDYVYIKGYKVLARRLFIDWKMPLECRLVWPIILDKFGNPLYIPRYQKDFVPTKDSNFYVKY